MKFCSEVPHVDAIVGVGYIQHQLRLTAFLRGACKQKTSALRAGRRRPSAARRASGGQEGKAAHPAHPAKTPACDLLYPPQKASGHNPRHREDDWFSSLVRISDKKHKKSIDKTELSKPKPSRNSYE